MNKREHKAIAEVMGDFNFDKTVKMMCEIDDCEYLPYYDEDIIEAKYKMIDFAYDLLEQAVTSKSGYISCGHFTAACERDTDDDGNDYGASVSLEFHVTTGFGYIGRDEEE